MTDRGARYEKAPVALLKTPTGIAGFDDVTGGGLPKGRTTLLVGDAGTGKTLFALQSLVNGARFHDESSIFVTFEESPERLRANAAAFGWDIEALEKDKLFLLDARVSPTTVKIGQFDLTGMLKALAAKVAEMGATRIVFNALDELLFLLNDPMAERREVYRLHEWLVESNLTCLMTVKPKNVDTLDSEHGFMPFMVDCVVGLHHSLAGRVALRHLRVTKYRGSGFADSEFPLVFGARGMEVGDLGTNTADFPALVERISTGIPRLDSMLEGGYLRGSSVLVTGSPGTAKSMLAGAFADAACRRDERALYVCFDEGINEMLRNAASIGIDLESHVKSGRLLMCMASSETKSAEEHVLQMKEWIESHNPRVVVVDPISAIHIGGGETAAMVALRRLVRLAKSRGITLYCASLLAGLEARAEASPIQISTIADTWIHLSYVVYGGERNRCLTIVKARGTGHSNQVRELTLDRGGIHVTDVYVAGGEVLTGTARWERERANRLSEEQQELETERRQRRLAAEREELRARMEAIAQEVAARDEEMSRLRDEQESRVRHAAERATEMLKRRRGDLAPEVQE